MMRRDKKRIPPYHWDLPSNCQKQIILADTLVYKILLSYLQKLLEKVTAVIHIVLYIL